MYRYFSSQQLLGRDNYWIKGDYKSERTETTQKQVGQRKNELYLKGGRKFRFRDELTIKEGLCEV